MASGFLAFEPGAGARFDVPTRIGPISRYACGERIIERMLLSAAIPLLITPESGEPSDEAELDPPAVGIQGLDRLVAMRRQTMLQVYGR
jgi:hypothetical protein